MAKWSRDSTEWLHLIHRVDYPGDRTTACGLTRRDDVPVTRDLMTVTCRDCVRAHAWKEYAATAQGQVEIDQARRGVLDSR